MKEKRAFTLLELMVVIAVVAILAAISLPLYRNYQLKTRFSEGYTNINGIEKAEKGFFAKFSIYVPAPQAPSEPPSPEKKPWPGNWRACNTDPEKSQSWCLLGWVPEGNVYFVYEIGEGTTQLITSTNQPCAQLGSLGFLETLLSFDGQNYIFQNGGIMDTPGDNICIQAASDINGNGIYAYLKRGDETTETVPFPVNAGAGEF